MAFVPRIATILRGPKIVSKRIVVRRYFVCATGCDVPIHHIATLSWTFLDSTCRSPSSILLHYSASPSLDSCSTMLFTLALAPHHCVSLPPWPEPILLVPMDAEHITLLLEIQGGRSTSPLCRSCAVASLPHAHELRASLCLSPPSAQAISSSPATTLRSTTLPATHRAQPWIQPLSKTADRASPSRTA